MFKNFLENVWEISKIIIISLLIIVPIRYFIIQPFFVAGASMEPNFDDGEYVIIDEISYNFKKPIRGEVVVFKYPNDPSQYYIKRIIGLPGENIKINNKKVFLVKDGKETEIMEDYLGDIITAADTNVQLGFDEYFVMGDNRTKSFDSRQWGPLSEKYIIGKVWIRIFPFNRFAIFDF
ncbi:MAG: signal peptidase I [Parcubacteria group bacterium GW2011_GWA2_38_13b]|nr:MAG: signal peptidase I [Parcubacteria group bacterium GW2011_GWA2_38_13b]